MLTKEECMEALDGLRNLERYENFKKWGGQVAPQIKADVIEQLICEHFEMVDKLKTGNLSDGYHTYNELYHHRAILFSVIVNQNKEIAWKSKKHHDGTMYDGMFIVGVNTPQGQYSYHYDIEPYWNMFDCKELDNAPVWDGHEPKDIDRLISIDDNPPLKFEELIKHEVVWDNEVKEYAFVLEQYKPILLNVCAPNDLLAISLKYRWAEEIECLLSQEVGESINDYFVPNRFYGKKVKE